MITIPLAMITIPLAMITIPLAMMITIPLAVITILPYISFKCAAYRFFTPPFHFLLAPHMIDAGHER